MESEKLKIYQNRLFVADLIKQVLGEKITVSTALFKFPKDKNDINIKCAFDALVHREADEELRKKIRDYSKTQDEYLMLIANFLARNEALPQNIISNYLEFHKDNLIWGQNRGIKNIFQKLKRMINF